MDKFFHSTFDFFTHALPGFCFALSFFILDPNLNTTQDFLALAYKINIGGGVMLLAVGYLAGFGLYPLGRWLYKHIGFKIWPKRVHRNVDIFIAHKYVLIRELSPVNFKYIETWNMYSAMAHNLSLAALSTFFLSLIKLFFLQPPNPFFWGLIAVFGLFFFFVFLYRAVVFFIWAADDINASIEAFKLQEKGERLESKSSKSV